MRTRVSIMARLALVVGISLSTMGSYVSCSSDGSATVGPGNGPGGGNGSGTFESHLTLRDSTGAETSDFTFGAPITMDFEIRNLTNRTVRVDFIDAQTNDFVVLRPPAETLVWQWSDGRAFAQVATTLTFAPYSTKSVEIVWNGILRDGTQLMPGSYHARAVLLFNAFSTNPTAPGERGSPLIPFTVH